MKKRVGRKQHKIPSQDSLAGSAVFYLSRFAASEEQLRRVLNNKIRRAKISNPDFAADDVVQQKLREAIESIIEKHKRSGVINDENFAKMKTRSLRNGGRSASAISARLKSKGVSGDIINGALRSNEDQQEEGDPELKAAMVLAKKRKLGFFGGKSSTPEQRKKDFAVMARAGFSYEIARSVLRCDIKDSED
ncbi:MAG: regulatory protein RecX [Alphaproteobacteria bacterium]|nr:regulatory protein RecX [Alphaproteobacteria bacterium]